MIGLTLQVLRAKTSPASLFDNLAVMPITISVGSDPHIGPGSQFTFSSDFVGPIPFDWEWELDVSWGGEGNVWTARRNSLGTGAILGFLGTDLLEWHLIYNTPHFPPEGTAVTVRARLVSDSFTVEDEGERTDLEWTTQGNFVRQYLTEQNDPGALTPTQAAQLAAVGPAVTQDFTLGGVVSPPVSLISLVAHPPIQFISVVGDPEVITGRGELTHPFGPIAVAAFGVQVTFFTIPAGFGYRDGAIREYQERIVQLAALQALANGTTEVLAELVDFNYEGIIWLWRDPFPTRLLYDVTPGCAVVIRWMGLALP